MAQTGLVTLRHLTIFASLYENKGNMTSTAEKCFIAQPAISLALSELESLYGCRLFDRISRKLYINEAGTRLYGYARKVLNLMEDMDQSMKNIGSGSSLRIGSCDSMDSRRLPQYVAAFAESHGDLKVRSVFEATESLVTKVLSNELDLAFVDRNPGNKRLVAEKFQTSKLVLAASPSLGFEDGHRITARELAAMPLLLREKGSGIRQVFDQAMENNGYLTEPVYEGAGNGCVTDAALAGMGIAVLPEKLIEDHRRHGELVRLEAEGLDLEINYYVVCHKDKELSRSAAEFVEMCHELEREYAHEPARGSAQDLDEANDREVQAAVEAA